LQVALQVPLSQLTVPLAGAVQALQLAPQEEVEFATHVPPQLL
jgi:hypothetical protein